MPQQFRALQTFEAVVNGRANTYAEGLTYTIRDGEIWDDLRNKVGTWMEEGKVELIGGVDQQTMQRIRAGGGTGFGSGGTHMQAGGGKVTGSIERG